MCRSGQDESLSRKQWPGGAAEERPEAKRRMTSGSWSPGRMGRWRERGCRRDPGRGREPEPEKPTRPRVRDSVRQPPLQPTAVPAPSSRCQGGSGHTGVELRAGNLTAESTRSQPRRSALFRPGLVTRCLLPQVNMLMWDIRQFQEVLKPAQTTPGRAATWSGEARQEGRDHRVRENVQDTTARDRGSGAGAVGQPGRQLQGGHGQQGDKLQGTHQLQSSGACAAVTATSERRCSPNLCNGCSQDARLRLWAQFPKLTPAASSLTPWRVRLNVAAAPTLVSQVQLPGAGEEGGSGLRLPLLHIHGPGSPSY